MYMLGKLEHTDEQKRLINEYFACSNISLIAVAGPFPQEQVYMI